MSINVVFNGVTYHIPEYSDTGWAQGQGNLSQYLVALASGGSSSAFITYTLVTGAGTTIGSGGTYLVDTTSGAITLNLPTPSSNTWFIIKDKKGTSAGNPITLHRAGSEKIDGTAADATLAAPYGSWGFFSDGTDWYQLFSA